jgi:hypothetical protein
VRLREEAKVRVAKLAVGQELLCGRASELGIGRCFEALEDGLGDDIPNIKTEVEERVFGGGGFSDMEVGEKERDE